MEDKDKGKKKDSPCAQKVWKLYLGGIPVNLNEAQLSEILEKTVDNFKVHIMINHEQGNSKGCGWLEVYSKKDFDNLLQNKVTVNGKDLQIEEYLANEAERQKRMFESNERSIHVTNLPLEADNKDLEDYFSKFGKLNRAYIIFTLGEVKKSRGFGFVEFESKKVAAKVLEQDHIILGKAVSITQRYSKKDLKLSKTKDSTKTPSNNPSSVSSKQKPASSYSIKSISNQSTPINDAAKDPALSAVSKGSNQKPQKSTTSAMAKGAATQSNQGNSKKPVKEFPDQAAVAFPVPNQDPRFMQFPYPYTVPQPGKPGLSQVAPAGFYPAMCPYPPGAMLGGMPNPADPKAPPGLYSMQHAPGFIYPPQQDMNGKPTGFPEGSYPVYAPGYAVFQPPRGAPVQPMNMQNLPASEGQTVKSQPNKYSSKAENFTFDNTKNKAMTSYQKRVKEVMHLPPASNQTVPNNPTQTQGFSLGNMQGNDPDQYGSAGYRMFPPQKSFNPHASYHPAPQPQQQPDNPAHTLPQYIQKTVQNIINSDED